MEAGNSSPVCSNRNFKPGIKSWLLGNEQNPVCWSISIWTTQRTGAWSAKFYMWKKVKAGSMSTATSCFCAPRFEAFLWWCVDEGNWSMKPYCVKKLSLLFLYVTDLPPLNPVQWAITNLMCSVIMRIWKHLWKQKFLVLWKRCQIRN